MRDQDNCDHENVKTLEEDGEEIEYCCECGMKFYYCQGCSDGCGPVYHALPLCSVKEAK